jgi:pSer/pThr/pTyr-binding forkhead associated (FHA) protein
METVIHLLITDGPSKGREIHVPRDGVRIGRSSRNDISIPDEAMSRFQCRFFIQEESGLWVSDLGSANGTMVNGKLVQEQQLHIQDEILAGDTRIRVIHDGTRVAMPEKSENAAESPESPEASVDLGLLKRRQAPGSTSANAMRRNLLWLLAFMVVLVLAIGMFKNLPVMSFFEPPRPVVIQPQADLPILELMFERVEGSVSNVFRYSLELKKDLLRVQVDDLQNDRHVRRDKKVAPELQRDLARSIEATGVLDLREELIGLEPGLYNLSTLSVTIGAVTRRIKVLNQDEPEIFATTRAMIEAFGKNELGLAALAVDPATLVEKAKLALLQGKKMWDEREVRNENLYNAIQAYKECEWYLETIQPKPAFYAEATSAKADCTRELQRRFEDLWFLAERSVKLREWKEADRQLKVICEMIPDRSDERNRNASKNLVDVERHLTTEK